MDELEVLRTFRDAVESRICGRDIEHEPGRREHPWIPGTQFHDGEIIRLLELSHSVAPIGQGTVG